MKQKAKERKLKRFETILRLAINFKSKLKKNSNKRKLTNIFERIIIVILNKIIQISIKRILN